jgi:rhamnogalacturonyl hydrolase YesR
MFILRFGYHPAVIVKLKRIIIMRSVCKKLALTCIFSSFIMIAAAQSRKHEPDNGYTMRAKYMFHKVWSLYRVKQYGLFSEYYPQQHTDTLTYMQDSGVSSKKVSFLWPFSGIFSATNMMMRLPGGKKHYAVFLDSVINGMEKYRDTSRRPVGYQAYPPEFEKSDRYYDDNGLVGIDYVEAYKNTGNKLYLERAKEVFAFILSGWSSRLGGGVTWLEGHIDQKPACSNGMATLVALKLYETTRDPEYLSWGLKFYNWMFDNLRDSVGLYWNDKKTADSSINKTYWTYNSGSMLEASVLLYSFTGEKKYIREAETTAEASYHYFGKPTKDHHMVILDMPWFVVVLFRGYEALYQQDHNAKYINTIIENVDHAWPRKDLYGLIDKNWYGTTAELSKPKWLLDEACMIEFYARIAILKKEMVARRNTALIKK